jgi:multiple sugar transport system ATP-binding protein
LARVQIKDLSKTFGETEAVKNLDLEVVDGSFVVLLGPSGCGKTTTLRCVAGLESPDDGEIYIGDNLVNYLDPKDRDIAMVFQSYALYPHMSVYNNIAFPLKMRKIAKSEIDERVHKTAELLRIKHLLDRKPKQISGGEAQRTALGRAIIRDPQVFLMDEPLSNLDAKLRVYMRVELKRLQKELGVTTIYVTHDQVEAMTMADKVAIMNLGVLQQFDETAQIFDHPSNLFVGGFIGSPAMNLLDCTLIQKDDGSHLETECLETPIPLSVELMSIIKELASGDEFVIGIRPEDTVISKRKTAESLCQAAVYVTEPLGSEIILNLQIHDTLLKARVEPTFQTSIGQKLWLGINRERMHLFDKKTEKAIF